MEPSARKEMLETAIGFGKPIEELYSDFNTIPWDETEILTVVRMVDVIAVLDRFLQGRITADGAFRWADLLEGREELGFAYENDAVEEAIFFLAHPEMNMPRGVLDHDFAIFMRGKYDG